MMPLKVLIVIAMCWVGQGWAEPATADIDFHDAYEAIEGEKLMATKQYEQAYATYSKLAAETSDPDLAILARARAAVALGLQDGKYEAGLEDADAIPDRTWAVQSRIHLMAAEEEYESLLDTFAGEDIPAWPERTLPKLWRYGQQDLRALALADRAQAYLATGDPEAAVRDLERALDFAAADRHKLRILSFLGEHVYRRTLRDVDKTFETNRRIVALNAGHATTLQARINVANRLSAEGQHEEALAVLGDDWKKSKSQHWFSRGMMALGDALAAAGQLEEAADAYRLMAEADDSRTNAANRSWAALQLARVLTDLNETEAAGMIYTELLARKDVPDPDREQARAALADLIHPTHENRSD